MDQLISIALGWLSSYLQGNSTDELDPRLRYAVSLGACVVAGFLSHGLQVWYGAGFDIQELLANIGIAFATSQSYYKLYFKGKMQL